ncbi:hypothetical protein HF670_04050 [Acidithiobacillus thiooxidans]|uniref:Uncharacterized protein n=1 Tax=Acidithiobacillus thiooxidans TaxID=930 RepID=A0A1C2I728_ACITH|nr:MULTISPECIES: hypothetical protein [Acidithiobacillus]MBU2743601.1 hypothetical protein [Acidithiobacillus albertensis]MBU2792408.1 hypothetical protein [Acidithiobacillus thiooxidans]MBU2838748.1 hypothetical protein [Acidithiobacillus thiooxidans]MBU2843192.1 hypothetical protein [Acidithiobacillus thiooxidans]MDR7926381.1 hypothetical protein [Acidithiobacillus thiooxidans]
MQISKSINAHKLKQFAGIVRRHEGIILPILKIDMVDGFTKLHIQGSVVDFWATPEELYFRGYWLLCAKPAIWDLWSRVICASDQAKPGAFSVH